MKAHLAIYNHITFAIDCFVAAFDVLFGLIERPFKAAANCATALINVHKYFKIIRHSYDTHTHTRTPVASHASQYDSQGKQVPQPQSQRVSGVRLRLSRTANS